MVPKTAGEHTVFGHIQERFELRAKALVYARLALMAVALLVITVPPWRRALSITVPLAAYWYVGMLAVHVVSFLWVGRPYSRVVLFVSLCLDLLVLLYVVVLSGGITSPLMPAQLVFTMLFALLFPSPLAIVPPLLMLPLVGRLDQLLGLQSMPVTLLLVLWYSALNVTVVYVVVYLEGREKLALQEVVRLQHERRLQALAIQRTRIARDIHDGVGAALSSILLQAEYLAGRLSDSPLLEELKQLRDAASDGMDELRRAVSILRQEFHLATALEGYVETVSTRHAVGVAVRVRGHEPELDPEMALAMFRIVQEALSNVVRHAKADNATVLLHYETDKARVQVQDDGVGFDTAQTHAGHYGLRNMAERANRLGGHVTIDSTPGQGTTITVELPLTS